MARPIMWLRTRPDYRKNQHFHFSPPRDDRANRRKLLSMTSDDNDDDGNTSDLSTNEYKSKTQPPLRSYRCSTNMAALQQFNAKMQSQSEGAEEGGEKKKDKFFSYEKSLYRSLFIFSEENIIRKVCRKITGNKIFDYFMLITIMANCIVLMAAEPLPENDTVELNKKLDQSDKVFVAIFIFEAILRIIANGFVIGQDAYLKSGWNILDFIVVISGAVHIITTFKSDPSSNKQTELIKALRAVRVLRPLKLVSGVPSLQVLMKSLIRAMVPLLQILLLVSFVIIIYSIVGLELLCGRFHYACFNATTQKLVVPISILKVRPCDPTGWGRKCNDGEICRRAKPHEWSGPNDGITSFDNMFLSMLTIFQCITLEGWSDILYYSLDSRDNSFQLIQWSAFILLIIVGSFFMLNLMLGVLSGEFAKERERVENRKNFLKLRKQRQIERSVDHYLHWISKAEDIIDEFDEEEEIEYENRCSPSGERRTSHYHHHHHSELARKRSRVSTTKRSKGNIFKRLERKFRFFIRRHLIKSKVFYWLVLILVLLNTVSMSLTKYNQQPDVKEVLDYLELVFTALFFIEMILRMYGLGLRGYFRSAFNKYDFVVVWLSIADLIQTRIQNTSSIGISVLRSVRLLRIFKVTRFWSSMQNVVSSLMNSMRSILSLILLLLLFIFIFALLGMQLFGGSFQTSYSGTSRTNFNSFGKAMLAVFQIMSCEDWNSIMYQGIKAYGGPKSFYGLLVSLYFVALVIVGNYTLLNVFLAIAVDNLANAQVLTRDEELEQREAEEQKKIRNILYSPSTPNSSNRSKWDKVRAMPKMLMFARQREKEDENPFKGVTFQGRSRAFIRAQSEASDLSIASPQQSGVDRLHSAVLLAHNRYKSLDLSDGQPTPQAARWRRKPLVAQRSFDTNPGDCKTNPSMWSKSTSMESNIVTVNENADSGHFTSSGGGLGSILRRSNHANVDHKSSNLPLSLLPVPGSIIELPGSAKVLRRRQLTTTKVINTRSLFLFPPSSRIRTWCHYIVNIKYFERLMLFFIVLSTMCLAIEDPLNTKATKNKVIYYLDVAFIAIFTFEITIKIIDQGAVLHKGSYLRDWWNVIDTTVVACNIAATVLTLDSNETVKKSIGNTPLQAMRIMRVFRSLRVVNKIKELKLVCQCVVFSLKRTFNIIIIIVLCLFMFAVIGVNLFNGKFQSCNDVTKMTKAECQGKYYHIEDPANRPDDAMVIDRVWTNYDFNFDNVGLAMLTLFSCGSGEGWPVVMEKSMDATEVDFGPIPNNRMQMALYYVAFVVVYSFFFLNIFVALIIVTFQEQGEKEITGSELDKNQRACLQFVLNAKPRQRFMPHDQSGFSFKVWRVVDSKPFEIIIMVMIALNAIGLMLTFDDQSEEYGEILEKINLAFTFIFTLEAILKLMAYKFNYFRDSWNVLDFCIVFITLVGAIINITKQEFAIDPSFFRLFRAFRLLKLLRQGYNIRILLWTFLQSLKGLPYVFLLIVMLFFIYAVIGVQLFGKIILDDRRKINEYNNFQSFQEALCVLFRCGTGETWHLVMLDCFDNAPCYNNPNEKCGSTLAAVIYFVTFYFLYAFLLLNLFVAVIMDNFDYLTRDESILGPHHMDEFVRVWSEYDPSAAGRIPHEDVYQLMCDMQPPVGFGKKCPKFLAYKRLMKLNMPISGDNTVLFTPTLFALVRTSLGMTPGDKECFRDSSFRKIIKRTWPNTTQKTLDILIPEQTVLSGQQITIGKIYAAKLIYESFKEIKRRKNCTLPQFEQFELNNQHKRGNSFFRKIKGVLRTSSQPLTNEKNNTRPREEYLNRRRRSNTAVSITTSDPGGKAEAARTFSVSNIHSMSHNKSSDSIHNKLRKNTISYTPDMFQSAPTINIYHPSSTTHQPPPTLSSAPTTHPAPPSVPAAATKRKSVSSSPPSSLDDDTPPLQQRNDSLPSNKLHAISPVTEQSSGEDRELTNSLITALRDPAKPILCFVNPQIHRDSNRSNDEDSPARTARNLERRLSNPSRISVERRSSNPRSRQKRVLVSLPMIKLEIPVDRDNDFLDIGTSSSSTNNNNNENIRNNNGGNPMDLPENDIPDLLKSLQRTSRSSSEARSSSDERSPVASSPLGEYAQDARTDGSPKDERREQESCFTDDDSTELATEGECEEILKELNNHLNKALSEGVQPQWLYEIKENEGDTWC
uniref:Voltage-dependent calcium channel alpha-1 subunit IQ domain-containing protein n=2 Tax=Clytia hemisphaerica TaxID=252671 RepID=A0A7M5WIZ7_9CNID